MDDGPRVPADSATYAGPTRVYGKGHCVDRGGNISNVYVQVSGSHCASPTEHRTTFTR